MAVARALRLANMPRMIDPVHPVISWYLWISTSALALMFAIPILVFPLRWARMMRWTVPADTRLTTYFARCLGGVATARVIGAYRAAPHPSAHPVVLEIIIAALGIMTLVHILGALERSQPWTENVEIAMYAVLTAIAWLMYRSL